MILSEATSGRPCRWSRPAWASMQSPSSLGLPSLPPYVLQPVTDVARVPVEVEDGGGARRRLARLLHQEHVQLRAVPGSDKEVVEGEVEDGGGGDEHPGVGRLLGVVQQPVPCLVED